MNCIWPIFSLCMIPHTAAAPPATSSPTTTAPTSAAKPEGPIPLKPFQQDIPAAAFKLDMLPIPGDPAKGIKPLWFSKTEITWESFDVFVYRLDQPDSPIPDSNNPAPKPDATTRPSKPYVPPDRGFGHEGFAAIGMSYHAAEEFCKWLSAKSGRHYRLPTEQEWEHACLAGCKGPYCCEDAAELGDYAWFADNAADSTHPVAKKKPNNWGLCDTLGNAAEWCSTPDGLGAVRGGSFLTTAQDTKATSRKPYDRSWNAADPQVPKSIWWLASAPFVGFRIVCDPASEPSGASRRSGPAPAPTVETNPAPRKRKP